MSSPGLWPRIRPKSFKIELKRVTVVKISFWSLFGPVLRHVGVILGHFGLFGPSWGHLGTISGPLWSPFGAILKPCWGHLGPSRTHLGQSRGYYWPSWAILGHLWLTVGPSSAYLHPSWGNIGSIWGHLRALDVLLVLSSLHFTYTYIYVS